MLAAMHNAYRDALQRGGAVTPAASGNLLPSRRATRAGNSPIPSLRLLCSLVVVLLASICRADTDPSNVPAGIETWLKCFFWLIGAVTALAVLWGKLFPKRQPPIEAEFVTKADLEKFCALRHLPMDGTLKRIEEALKTMEEDRKASDLRHEKRASLIHGRINRLVPVVCKIAGRMSIPVPQESDDVEDIA